MSFGLPAQQPAADVPVCPRHPDRVSYVRCQRCGRPVCPECQRPAAVGVLCVDCVRESAKAVPATRTPFGGVARTGRPLVTYTLIGLCIAVYGLQWLVPGFTEDFWYAPLYTMNLPLVPFEPWRMLTSAFLHSQGFILHIAFNMYVLWILGQQLEPLLGRLRFAAVYLVSAVGGSVGVLLLGAPNVPVLGASGAIFGLFGALFVIQRRRGGSVRSLLILIIINLALGFFVSGIAWQAHIGGLLTGGLCALPLAYAPQGRNRNLVQLGGFCGVVVVLAAAAAARIYTI